MQCLHVLASGSKGNSYCIETRNDLIFIDTGISATDLKFFARKHRENKNITCVITHEHIDHVRGLKSFVKEFEPQVFSSEGTAEALRQDGVNPRCLYPLEAGRSYSFDHFALTGFDIPHDAAEPFGWIVETENCTTGFLTDLGCVTKEHLMYLRHADTIVLESNYDEAMLKKGRYPAYLKKRIASTKGHLSNEIAMLTIASLAGGRLKKCLFAHISEENNEYSLVEHNSSFCSQSYGISADVLRQKTYYLYHPHDFVKI